MGATATVFAPGSAATAIDNDPVKAALVNASSSAADWVSRIALVGVQTAAVLAVKNYESQKYDEIERDKQGYLSAGLSGLTACMDNVMEWVKAGTDDVPAPAIFQPVSPAGQQIETIASNVEALCYGKDFAALMNKHHREADIARAISLNPKYYDWQKISADKLTLLMSGQMSAGKLLNITGDIAENSVLNGKFGLNKALTARMIGVEQENLAAMARQENRLDDQNRNQNINPLARQANLDNYMIKPQDALMFGLQQALYIQNSLQNENNAYAKKEPYIMQQVNIMITKCLNALQIDMAKAGVVNDFVPNYSAIFQGQIQDLSRATFDAGSSLFGGPSSAEINRANGNFGDQGRLQ